MGTVEVLRKARELIADPEHWTQSAMARSVNNRPCRVNGPAAYKWCAVGATLRVESVESEFDGTVYDALADAAGDQPVTAINDWAPTPTFSRCSTVPSRRRPRDHRNAARVEHVG